MNNITIHLGLFLTCVLASVALVAELGYILLRTRQLVSPAKKLVKKQAGHSSHLETVKILGRNVKLAKLHDAMYAYDSREMGDEALRLLAKENLWQYKVFTKDSCTCQNCGKKAVFTKDSCTCQNCGKKAVVAMKTGKHGKNQVNT